MLLYIIYCSSPFSFRPGDLILSINEYSLDGYSVQKAEALIKNLPKGTIKITAMVPPRDVTSASPQKVMPSKPNTAQIREKEEPKTTTKEEQSKGEDLKSGEGGEKKEAVQEVGIGRNTEEGIIEVTVSTYA